MVDLYELPERGTPRKAGEFALAGPSMIHDFIVTANHLVFFVAPLRLRVLRALFGKNGFMANLAWRPELGTEVIVVPMNAPSQPVRFDAEPFWTWHFVNAFERGSDLVVDLVRYPDFASERWLEGLTRGRVEGAADGVFARAIVTPSAKRLVVETRSQRPCEFPRIDDRVATSSHRCFFAAAHTSALAARGPQDAIARIEAESGRERLVTFGPATFPSEPVFVARPGSSDEGDGWVLTLVYDSRSHTSHLAVLDASLDADPIARVHFDHHLPLTFHGAFVPAVV